MQSPLRNVRKAHGFTLQHVAAGVQVNPATLSRIERLEQIPSIELAERLPNDELFGIIYTVDEGDDWTDPQVLEKAKRRLNRGAFIMTAIPS